MTGVLDGGRRPQGALAIGLAALLVLSGCSGLASSDARTTIQFEETTDQSGLAYETKLEGGIGNGNEGVYVLDVDRDGWQDVLVTGGDRPALFENRNGTFERSGQLADLERPYQAATVIDYDDDGWRDVMLFGKNGSTTTLHNDEGTLERTDVGLGNFTYPMGATAADYDGDGDQDLFVYQSGNWANGKPQGYFFLTGYIREDNGNRNYFYENVDGEFRRVDAGPDVEHWSLAASAVDVNGDGLPDVHTANDFYYDGLYVNQGNWTFEYRQLGNRTARNGMSSEVADVNGDRRPDLFVTNIYLPLEEELSPERYERIKQLLEFVVKSGRTEGNTMLMNGGNGTSAGTFTDRASGMGVQHGGWGWAASFNDFDNDGDDDLMHTTQYAVQLNRSDPHYTYPMLYEQRSNGTFRTLDASERGLSEADGRGMVAVDYDHDGEREVITNNYGGHVRVYDNTGRTGNSVELRVVGSDGAPALGATITVAAGGTNQTVHLTDQTDFLSQESVVVHAGIGDAERATVTVQWPDGTERTVDVTANRRVLVGPDRTERLAALTDADDGTAA